MSPQKELLPLKSFSIVLLKKQRRTLLQLNYFVTTVIMKEKQ
jgi:hypothetical protein